MFEFKATDFIALRPIVRPVVLRLLGYDNPKRPMGDEPFEEFSNNKKMILMVGVATGLFSLLGVFLTR